MTVHILCKHLLTGLTITW